MNDPYAQWTSLDAPIVVARRRADVAEQVIGGEALLFDPASGQTHMLNATALMIWKRCDGRSTTRDIAREITETHDGVDDDTALDHVEQVVARLADLNLLH